MPDNIVRVRVVHQEPTTDASGPITDLDRIEIEHIADTAPNPASPYVYPASSPSGGGTIDVVHDIPIGPNLTANVTKTAYSYDTSNKRSAPTTDVIPVTAMAESNPGNLGFPAGFTSTGPAARVWTDGAQYLTLPNAYTSVLPAVTAANLAAIGLDAEEAELFDTESWQTGDLQAVVTTVPPGDYTVHVYMRELFNTAAGLRIMASLDVNGVNFATNIDLYQYGIDTYGQANAALVFTNVVTVAGDGLLTVDATMQTFAGSNGTICGLRWTAIPAAPETVLQLNFSGGAWDSGGLAWEDGDRYVLSTVGNTSGPNAGLSFQGPVDQLTPALPSADQYVVSNGLFGSVTPFNVAIQVPGLQAGSWVMALYAAQYNNPPIDPRSMTVDFQQGQSQQLLDFSGTNAALSCFAEVQVLDEGGGVGQLYIDTPPTADKSAVAAVTAYRRTGSSPKINAGNGTHLSPTGQWAADNGLFRPANQNSVTTTNTITNVGGVGLDPVIDQDLFQVYRTGFDTDNGGHSLFYDLRMSGEIEQTIRIYSFEPSGSGNVPGDRVVDVYINDALQVSDIDVLVLANDTYDQAITYSWTYTPSGSGEVAVGLEFRGRPSGGNYSPVVAAIEYLPTETPSFGPLLDQTNDPILDSTNDPILTVQNAPNGSQGAETSAASFESGSTTGVNNASGAETSSISAESGRLWKILISTGNEISAASTEFGFTTGVNDATGAEISAASIEFGAAQRVKNSVGNEVSPASVESGTSTGVNASSGSEVSAISVESGYTSTVINVSGGAETSAPSTESGRLTHGTLLWVPVPIESTTPWRPV